tara:strand:- start:66 stop:728 length:663 start_codon:yes stop_codon:yes gene_type:complete
MKKWTQAEARAGRSVSPESINAEVRAQQASLTALDRAQMPGGQWLNDTYLADYALIQVWENSLANTTGEQTNERDASVGPQCWVSSTIQTATGGWRTLTTETLTGFKGGSLFVEWSCNVYANNVFAYGINEGKPGSPNYINMRILVNGVNIGERRGGGYHQQSRIIGTQRLPPGDLTLSLQWRDTPTSQDAATVESYGGSTRIPYAHLWNNRWIAIGRYR